MGPINVFSCLPPTSRFEVELRLTQIPVESGLHNGGCRGLVLSLVTGIRCIEVDGFVQRIPVHDLKVVIRGTAEHVQSAIQVIRSSIDCDIEQLRSTNYHAWPSKPS